MSEYIIEWSGIGARIVELIGSVPACLIPKRLREERLREPIVRCRDCAKLNIVGECPCGFWALENLDGFCSYGERK